MVMITKITSLRITMFSTNKSKSNTNINKRKNSAALAAKKDRIDSLNIDNSRLNFISTSVARFWNSEGRIQLCKKPYLV